MSFKKYLPKESLTVLMQGYIPADLWEEINDEREKLDITWNEWMEAAGKAFLEDVRKK